MCAKWDKVGGPIYDAMRAFLSNLFFLTGRLVWRYRCAFQTGGVSRPNIPKASFGRLGIVHVSAFFSNCGHRANQNARKTSMSELFPPPELVSKCYALVSSTHAQLGLGNLPARITVKENMVALAMIP